MTSRGLDGEVCIGIPIAISQGYPAVAPPPRRSYPPHNSLDSNDSSSANISKLCSLSGFFQFSLAVVILFLFSLALSKLFDPSFKIESISVALDKSDLSYNQSAAIRVSWDVGFSIKNAGSDHSSVSVRCLSSYWSASLIQDHSFDRTYFHTVVITSLPREFVLPDHHYDQLKMRGLTLHFDVMIKTTRGRLGPAKGMCKNMSIVIPPNQTQGFMVGGPRSCPW